MWAEEVLRDKQATLTAQGIGKLTLLATGSKALADDAMSERIAEDLRRGIKSEI